MKQIIAAITAAVMLAACASTSNDVVKQEVASAQTAMFNYFTEYAARGGNAARHSPEFVQQSAITKVAPSVPHLNRTQLQEIAAQEYDKARTAALRHHGQ
jgi:hypothetical protein